MKVRKRELYGSKAMKFIAILFALMFCNPYVGIAVPMLGGEWTIIAQEDNVGSGGFVGPGYGGQAFDAEYLFFQQNGDIISIGLQTGFDLTDGAQYYSGKWYYSGDLALSFDGNTTSGLKYEYAIDFGFLTKDYSNVKVGGAGTGVDLAGVYQATTWNNNVYGSFSSSSPFAMSSGVNTNDPDFILSSTTISGSSYLRTASFSLSGIGLDPLESYTLDAHWTMSCGNDVLNGRTTTVPEPQTLISTALGLAGLVLYRKKYSSTHC